MNLPKFDVIFDRKKRGSATQPATIEIRITLSRKCKYISTGIKILPSEWDPTLYIKKNPQAFAYRKKITDLLAALNNNLNRLLAKNMPVTLQSVTETTFEDENATQSFIEFAREEIKQRTDISEGTRRNHRKLITALEAFKKIKYFGDITPIKVREFDQWLHKKEIKQTTIASYHKFFKVYIHVAMTKDLIAKDPYLGFRVPQGNPAQRKFLMPEEIEKIKNAVLPRVLEKVRDMFLFQYYTGLAYSDMVTFSRDKVTERDGRYILTAQRMKTNEDYYVVLLPKAVEILEKYNWLLPSMTLEQYNMRLKLIAEAAGIKKISSHMARHSFAVNALNKGIKIEVVSKILGHTNINTTQLYAKVIDKTVENAFDHIAST